MVAQAQQQNVKLLHKRMNGWPENRNSSGYLGRSNIIPITGRCRVEAVAAPRGAVSITWRPAKLAACATALCAKALCANALGMVTLSHGRDQGLACVVRKVIRLSKFPLQKYFRSLPTQITCISLTVPSHRGAARDRHERGAGCDGRELRT